MADILVIHTRHGASFILGSLIFLIVINYHIHTVRIMAGDHHIYHIFKPLKL